MNLNSTKKIFLIKIDNWLRGLSPLGFIGAMCLAHLLSILILAPILLLVLGEIPENSFNDWSFTSIFIVLILIAPIVETLLCQMLVINICTKWLFKLKDWIAIIISATIFGAGHYSSWETILVTLSSGLIFAYSFVIYRDKKTFSPSLMVMILHAIFNIPPLVAAYLKC